MRRLWNCIAWAGLRPLASKEANAIRMGDARAIFLSAEPAANVVGHTASILLEADEAQDIDEEKFDREFRPMAATTNATTVYYGTAWDDRSLLEHVKQQNLALERRDGVRRHFQYDWEEVARDNVPYRKYVENERDRLGERHPMFLTQYRLITLAGEGRLLTAPQRAQLQGSHERRSSPSPGGTYVAGLDLAGGAEALDAPMPQTSRGRDSTVLTIGRLDYAAAPVLVGEPRVEIVEHIAWTGEPHELLLPRLIDLLRDVWHVTRVAVDATGLGETAARLLAAALGESRVEAVKFSAERKSKVGFALLAAVNGGRLKVYRADGSAECREFWHQCWLARVTYRANQTMNFFVEAADGHDDYLISAALLVEASRAQRRRVATGRAS